MTKRLLLTGAIIALTACSTPKDATHTATTTRGNPVAGSGQGSNSATQGSTATAGASPTTVAIPATTKALGDKVPIDGGIAQVFAYTAPVASTLGTPAPGTVFATIDIQICAGAAGLHTPGPAGLTLIFPDGTQQGPRAPMVSPVYAVRVLKPAGCTRGFVTFQVRQDEHPTMLVLNATGVGWRLS